MTTLNLQIEIVDKGKKNSDKSAEKFPDFTGRDPV